MGGGCAVAALSGRIKGAALLLTALALVTFVPFFATAFVGS